MLALHHIGKQIYWLQQLGDFALRLEYVMFEDNVPDTFTRQSAELETSLSDVYFLRIWKKWGPFDLMPIGAHEESLCSASLGTLMLSPKG